MNRLDNVVTVGVIVSEYMRRLDIRLKTQGHRATLDSPAAPVIIAGCIYFQQAAGAHNPCEGSNAGRHFSFDVTTPFEV